MRRILLLPINFMEQYNLINKKILWRHLGLKVQLGLKPKDLLGLQNFFFHFPCGRDDALTDGGVGSMRCTHDAERVVALVAAVLLCCCCHTARAVKFSVQHKLERKERQTLLREYGLAIGARVELRYSCDPQVCPFPGFAALAGCMTFSDHAVVVVQCDGSVLITIVNEAQRKAWYTFAPNIAGVRAVDCSTPSFVRWPLTTHGELSWTPPSSGRYAIMLQRCTSSGSTTVVVRRGMYAMRMCALRSTAHCCMCATWAP